MPDTPTTAATAKSAGVQASWFDRAMSRLLRSKLHRLVSGSLALLTYTGTVSGRSRTLVVQYVEHEGRLIVWAGRADQKRWWRNFRSAQVVTVRLRGVARNGTAELLTDGAEKTEALRAYLARYPRTRRDGKPAFWSARWTPTDAELADAATEMVFVAIAA